MSNSKENIKMGLLGLISVVVLINTYMIYSLKSKPSGIEPAVGASSAVMTNPAQNSLPTMNPNIPNPNDPNITYMEPNSTTEIGSTPPSNQKVTRMSFGQYLHDFGTVKQNSTNRFSFKFTNTGDEPLVISNAVGSCGCTVPNYPKEPIAPGKSANIDVEYKPGTQSGAQDKKVTVTANTDPATTTLTIKANVVPE